MGHAQRACFLPNPSHELTKMSTKSKKENSQKAVIKFSVLFKILVLILKKEVHFLVFSFRVRL